MADKVTTKHKDDKFLFTRNELAEAFTKSPATITNMLRGIPHETQIGQAKVWRLDTVTSLKDVRYKVVDEDSIPESTEGMTLAEKLTHYKAEEARENVVSKRMKNDLDRSVLLQANDVEVCLAKAFKAIVLLLGTLPDALERDGLIKSDQIMRVINMTDSARDQLAVDLSEFSRGLDNDIR